MFKLGAEGRVNYILHFRVYHHSWSKQSPNLILFIFNVFHHLFYVLICFYFIVLTVIFKLNFKLCMSSMSFYFLFVPLFPVAFKNTEFYILIN